MRQVINRALNVIGQRKSRSLESKGQAEQKESNSKASEKSWDMSPEDALRVGTVAGYK